MRTRAKSPKGLALRAVAGAYTVFLGFNVAPKQRKGLLGFAIHRTDHTEDRADWLRGGLTFPGVPHDFGDEAATDVFPIQKFRWGDYTAKPNHDYTYRVQAMYGKPGKLRVGDAVTVRVRTEDPLNVGGTGHAVHFNRSAAASQAYVRRFGDKDPQDVRDAAAFRWLSRGLEENLVAFVARAKDKTFSLHLCVYEFEKDNLLKAVADAVKRKVKVEVLYDAIPKAAGPRKDNEAAIRKHKLQKVCQGRAALSAISHHKFIVLCKSGAPVAVWTGSTNFTPGAIYGQANVGHAIEDKALAQKFYALHQALRADPDLKESRQLAEALSPVPPPAAAAKLYPVFSPRSTIIAVETCAQFIDHARDLVCFTAPFALHDRLEDALDDPGDRFLKFGLLNSRGNVVERVHRTAGNRIASATALTTKLERFQKESLHHRGVFIHTKFILIDPLGPAPIVVTGSANFSDNSCRNNDENQLIIRDAPAVADVYFGEFMRLYDHYTFRDFVSRVKDKPKARYLATDDSWSAKYFAGGREARDREVFSA